MFPIKGSHSSFQPLGPFQNARSNRVAYRHNPPHNRRTLPEGRSFGRLTSILLFLFFVFLNVRWGGCESEMLLPLNILELSPGNRAVIVDKATQQFYLLFSDGNHLKMEKRGICTTGKKEGMKEKAGDKRTPEGVYFCKRLLFPPSLPAKYGPCALPLNYPNLIDRKQKRGGNGIWIHGIHKNRPTRDTLGCVVLENPDLVYLSKRIHLLTTPIIIVAHTRFVTEKTRKKRATKDVRFLEHWKHYQVTGNFTSYLACYASSFTSRDMNLSRWRDYKRTLFKRYRSLKIQILNPTIIHTEKYDFIAFKEELQGKHIRLIGYKRLYLLPQKTCHRIFGEEWIPFQTIKKSWNVYRRNLTRVKPLKVEYHILGPTPIPIHIPPMGLHKKIQTFFGLWNPYRGYETLQQHPYPFQIWSVKKETRTGRPERHKITRESGFGSH